MLNFEGCSLYQVGKTMQMLVVTRKGLTIFAAGSLHYSRIRSRVAGIVYDKFLSQRSSNYTETKN